jgi:hypothetical protein
MDGHFFIKPQVVMIDISFFESTSPVLEEKIRGSSMVYLHLIYGERDIKVIADKTKMTTDMISDCITMFLELGLITKTKDIMYLQRKVSSGDDFRVSLADLKEDEKSQAIDSIKGLESLSIDKWNTNSFIEYFKGLYYVEHGFKTKELMTLKEKKFIVDMTNEYGKDKLKGLIEYSIKNWDILLENVKKSYVTLFGIYQNRQFLIAEYNLSLKVKNAVQGEWL